MDTKKWDATSFLVLVLVEDEQRYKDLRYCPSLKSKDLLLIYIVLESH
jgi:hypothetical protein